MWVELSRRNLSHFPGLACQVLEKYRKVWPFTGRDVCQMHARCMSDEYQMYVRWMSDVYQMNVICMPDVCQMYARCMSDECQMYVRCMSDAWQRPQRIYFPQIISVEICVKSNFHERSQKFQPRRHCVKWKKWLSGIAVLKEHVKNYCCYYYHN